MTTRGRFAFRGVGAALVVGAALWCIAIEPGRLVVHAEEIRLPRWPRELDGLVVVAISDIHAGAPHMSLARLREIVATANAQRPDLVFLLGDYVIQGVVGGRFIPPEAAAIELGALRARLGVYAVLGNHDHWLGAARVRAAFEAAGIPVVDDRRVALADRGRRFSVVGLSDAWSAWPDIRSVMRQVPDEPTLSLTHNPDLFPQLPARVDLLVAGHTHGGQVRLPGLGAPIVPSQPRYTAGHIVEDGRHLFVTTGVGTSIVPVRFGVPPEIAVLRLRALGSGERMPASD